MYIKKILAGISAMAMLGSMALASPAAAMAEESNLRTAEDAVTWMKTGARMMTFPEEGPYEFFQNTEAGSYTADNLSTRPTAPAPARFDLRNVDGKNYVSPVKQQNPYGTCWAFAATSAAETSFSYEAGIDWNSAPEEELALADFSERHLAYFAATPLTDNPLYPSQNGEGLVRYKAELVKNSDNYTEEAFNDAFFNTGGLHAYASTLYSAMVGPAPESVAPYQNDEGIKKGTVIFADITDKPEAPFKSVNNLINVVGLENLRGLEYHSPEDFEPYVNGTVGELDLDTTDWYKGAGRYYYVAPLEISKEGTWSVDESKRFAVISELEGSRILPCPAMSDEKGAYVFNEAGLNAIKQELVSGRAVSISYQADQSRPGDPVKKGSTMNFLDADGNPTDEPENAAYWCQYTFDTDYDPTDPESINHLLALNHAVTIVGYDDTIPKEYFRDPNGTIGGDGAFIVKNSWGSKELDGTGWGNNGEGYFYLSYYDQSIHSPESFDFRVLTDERVQQEKYSAVNLDMYDLMPAMVLNEMAFDTNTSMANVFTARADSEIRSVGYTAVSCNETVSYDIYILNEDATSPTDGVLAGHAEEVYPYAGYQRTDLEMPVIVREGQKYSIVVTAQREDGCYGVGVRAGFTKSYWEKELSNLEKQIEAEQDAEKRSVLEYEYDQTLKGAQYAVSVINPGESFLLADNTWTDWADMAEEYSNGTHSQYVVFDNFSIKVYADSEILNVVNEIKEPQEQYQAGDVVEGQVTVTNAMPQAMGAFTFKLNDAELTTVDSIPSMESIVLPYEYTVTAEDLENGFFTTAVSAFMTQGEKTVELNLIDGFSTTVAKVSLKNEQETTEQPTETPTEQPETDAPTETTPAAEATYTADRLCEMALKDYEVRTGVKPETAESTAAENGKVVITLKDKDGNVLDTYTVDEKTALGTCSSGEVNLPQTGSHNPSTAAAAAGSVAAVMAGLFFAMKSGVFRRKD